MTCPPLVAVWFAVLSCLCQVSLVAAADCNENGADDATDIASATSEDCNDDGVPDECEFAPLNFGRGETLAAGDAPKALLTADLSGDGIADLVTGNQAVDRSSSLWVFLNSGDGTYADGVEYAAGKRLSAVVAADLDADGDTDLASANSTEVLVFANRGDGVLDEPVALAVPQFTRFVTALDVTGEGVLDLVVSNTNDDTVSVLVGTGDGTFAAPVAYAVGESPRQVAFGDLDGDGNLDLVSANWGSRSVSVLLGAGAGLLGAGAGTVRPQTSYDTGQRARALEVADLGGDGGPDLVVQTSSGLLYFENSGSGTFLEPQEFGPLSRSFSLADFDGDRDVDLVAELADGRSLVVLSNDGSGRLVTSLTLNLNIWLTATDDLDADGDVDIVFTVPDRSEVGLLLSGGGSLPLRLESLPADTPHSAVVVDLDGDGYDDIATPDGPTGYLSVYPNLSDGTFGTRQRYLISTGGHLESIAAGDIDGDSDIDLAISDRALHYVAVLLGAGDGTFGPVTRFETGRVPWAVTLGDFDGDGFLDMASAGGQDHSITLYLGNGAGGFVGRQDLTVGITTSDVEHGDLDGDGNTDLVATSAPSAEVFILRGDGSGGFSEPASIPVPQAPHSLRIDDLEGDGDLDIVGAGRTLVVVLLNNGTGNFALPSSFPLDSPPSKIHTDDLNLDGVVDLLVPHWQTDTLGIWLGAGDGTFAQPIEVSVGSLPKVARVSDLDHDGDMDIVCANRGRPHLGFFEDIAVLYNQEGAPLFEGDSLQQVCTALDFEKLSAPRRSGVVERATEYLLPTHDDEMLLPSLYQNARRFATQREFLRNVFPERFGDLAASEYNALVEKRQTRQYHGGTISRLRMPSGIAYGFDVFTDEAEPAELLSLEETRALLERLGVSFALRPLGYLPGTTQARELAASWEEPGFPVLLIEEPPPAEEPEPGAPTFTLQVPGDMEICGTFAEAGADRGVRQEYELKSTLRLRGGTFPLPTEDDSFPAELFEEVRFGPEQEVAPPLSEGSFRMVRVPGLEGVTTYRFTHAQTFLLPDGRELEIALVSPLQYRGRGDEALDEPVVLTDEFFTALTGNEAIQATLDGVPSVRYGSCTYDTLPRVEVRAELEDGTTVRLIERFREASSEVDTAPAGLVRAEVVVGAERRLVDDYWSLGYSAFRHNTGPSYWVLFGEPLRLPDLDRVVHGVELVTEHPPLRPAAVASYLDINLETVGHTGVRALSRRTLPAVSRFRRGDANADGELNVLDALKLLEYLFRRTPALSCAKSGDANDDGRLNILDATVLVSQLFGGRGFLPPPFAECGEDPSADGLHCNFHAPCESRAR
jgi:hypothetical protein